MIEKVNHLVHVYYTLYCASREPSESLLMTYFASVSKTGLIK